MKKGGVQMCRNSISGSADSADHHVEIAGSFAGDVGAISSGHRHLFGLAVGVGDQGTSSGLHDGHGTGGGTCGNTQCSVGFTQSVQAAVLENRSITSQQGVGDVTQNDLTIAQASSHLAVGVNATVGGGQTGVLAADACNGVGNDAASVGSDGVNSVEALVAIGNEGLQRGQFAAANERAAGIG